MLVDTGATVSVVSKEIVDRILERSSDVSMLPIHGVQVSNAIGRKVCKVSKQISCKCQIGGEIVQASFIQVDKLNENGIIGADILNLHQDQVHFDNKTLNLLVGGKKCDIKFHDKRQMLTTSQIHNIVVEDIVQMEEN